MITRLLIVVLISVYSFDMVSAQEYDTLRRDHLSHLVSIHLLPGDSEKLGAGLGYTYLWSPYQLLSFGIGVGYESYDFNNRKAFIPLTIKCVADFGHKNNVIPFFDFGIGYGIGLPEEEDFAEKSLGGVILHSGIGLRINNDEVSPFLHFGFRMQRAKYSGTDIYGNMDKEVIYKRYQLSLGVRF